MIQIIVPCSQLILSREIHLKEVEVQLPVPNQAPESQSKPSFTSSTRYVFSTKTPPPSRATPRVEVLSALPLDLTGSISSGSGIADLLIVKTNGEATLSLGAAGDSSSSELRLDLLKMLKRQGGQLQENQVIKSLEQPRGSRFTVNLFDASSSTHHQQELHLDLKPWCERTKWALQSFDLLLDSETARYIRKSWIESRFGKSGSQDASAGPSGEASKSDWECLVDVLVNGTGATTPVAATLSSNLGSWEKMMNSSSHSSHFDDQFLPSLQLGSRKASQQYRALPSSGRTISTGSLKSIISILHLLGQESRLNLLKRDSHLEAFAQLLVKLGNRFKASSVVDYWMRLVPESVCSLEDQSSAGTTEVMEDLSCFDIYDLLYSRFSQTSTSSVQEILHQWVGNLSSASGLEFVAPRSTTLLFVFSQFSPPTESDSTPTAQKVTDALVKTKIGNSEIDLLPLAVSIPLKEALRTCQLSPPSRWNVDAYRLADRPELARQLELDEGLGLVPVSLPSLVVSRL